MTFNFSSISQTSLGNSMEYLQRHFLNHSACFSLEQTTDINIDRLFWVLRYSAHCNGLELLPEPPKNKICYRLRPKYESFSCFPIICSSAIWKSLFLRNRSYLPHFFLSWRKLTECYSKLLLTTSATCRLFSCTFHESTNIDVTKKVDVILCNFWICSKNLTSSRGHYLQDRSVQDCSDGRQLQSNSVIKFDQPF